MCVFVCACVCVCVALKPPRKSNCVKEIERLKKNREERRFVVLFTFAHASWLETQTIFLITEQNSWR